MLDVIGSLLPLGLAVALSPFPVIAIILVLLSERARASGPAFLAGWVLATTVVAIVFTALAKTVEPSDPDVPNPLTGVLRLALGALLLVLAVRKLRGGPKLDADGEPELPGWMSTLTSATAGRSFTMALLLAGANPKNLAITAAASLSIGTGGLAPGEVVWSIVVFALIASATIVVPVVGHAFFAAQLDAPLRRLEVWLLGNHTAVMGLLLVIFGVILLGNGIASF
ncbi:GAP family protein [Plantibacter flavus]|uniref:GAP family protein n=1 Tax=Plantibacter flavus TaxID=150123 RepID=UPI003F149B48